LSTNPFSVLVAVIFTAGITAPVVSDTVPAIPPVSVCADSLAGASPIETIKPSKSMQADVMAFNPPCLLCCIDGPPWIFETPYVLEIAFRRFKREVDPPFPPCCVKGLTASFVCDAKTC
jgi:hypothetical protein